MWKKVVDGCLAGVGVAALVEGWRRMRTRPSKPTEEDEFTRVDYLSGEYQRAFEEKQREREQTEVQGKWCIVAGAALLAGGVALLTQAIVEESRETRQPDDPSAPNGSSPRSSHKQSSESVPEMSE